jgi:hypothetical protein
MQPVWVARRFERTAALACVALASACITGHSERRDVVATSPVDVAATVPVATSSVAAAPQPERPTQLADRPVPPPRPDPVQRVIEAARADLGKRGGSSGVDCSTYVRSAFLAAGVDLYAASLPRDNGVQAIHRYVRKHGNRVLDDLLTHVGIVEDVLADGTALVLHATNHGVVREPMNLRRPHTISDARGQQINAALRRRSAFDSPRTPHLMSELFAGFGRVLGTKRDAHPVARRSTRSLRAH